MQNFGLSFAVTALCLGAAAFWGAHNGGLQGALSAVWIAAILGVLEVSLSFDNAVVNASVLRNWNAFWQKLFLTVGILVAVFGMRLLFPLLIVSQTTDLGLAEVWSLALNQPDDYSRHLMDHHAEVSAFGGTFLLLVFLNFLLDQKKETHWFNWFEVRASKLGAVNAAAVLIVLVLLIAASGLAPGPQQLPVLLAGLWGIITYLGVDVIGNLLEAEDDAENAAEIVKRGSIAGFLYLEVLDASFSFDGVIGAFAVTKDVVLIMLGLAIGAMFVRSLTVYLVRKGTLDEFIYLEHGAHYAIGALGCLMLLSMQVHIPETLTALIGVIFIGLALFSSTRHNQAE